MCRPKNTVGNRISDLKLLGSEEKIDPNKNYVVGGWGSVNPEVKGPPIYKLLEKYIIGQKIIKPKFKETVKVEGV